MQIQSDIPQFDMNTVVERSEVDFIHNLLQRKNILIISGTGGSGKTTLAALYAYKYRDAYEKIFKYIGHDISSEQDFVGKVKELNLIGGCNLLIIDEITEKKLLTFIASASESINKNWNIILISRISLGSSRTPTLVVGPMTMAESDELIRKNLKDKYEKLDVSKLKNILQYLENHPLMISLVCSLIKNNPSRDLQSLIDELSQSARWNIDYLNKPIEIYLDTNNDNQIKKTYKSIEKYLDFNNFLIKNDSPTEKGSWFKRIFASYKNTIESEDFNQRVDELEHSLKIHTITKSQSEIDKNQAEAVSTIIESVKDIPNAAIKIGSLLIIKTTNSGVPNIAVKNLSIKEMVELEHKPSLLRNPQELLEKLVCLE